MEQLTAEVIALRKELEELKNKDVEKEDLMEDDEVQDDDGDFNEGLGSPSKWGAVLGSQLKNPVCPAAIDFVSMLQSPPHLMP